MSVQQTDIICYKMVKSISMCNIPFSTNNFQIGSISFIGKLETDTGWLKNLATVNRINDVSVTRPDPMKTSFHVTLRIKDLQVGTNALSQTWSPSHVTQ